MDLNKKGKYRYPWKIKPRFQSEEMSALSKTRHALERSRNYLEGVGVLLSTLPYYQSGGEDWALFAYPGDRLIQIRWDSNGAAIPGIGIVKKGRDIMQAMAKLEKTDI